MIRRRLRQALDWRVQAVTRRLESAIAHADAAERQLRSVDGKLTELGGSIEALRATVSTLAKETGALRSALDEGVQPMLRAIVDEESDNRRALYNLRADPAYESPYTDPDPLVSIVMATVGRAEMTSRALPSLLSQSHSNIEVIIVGDHTRPEVKDTIRGLGDERVRYSNLSQRLVAHPDPHRNWLVGSTMARNEATRQARGQWLLHFDDDDRLRPDSISRLLAVARRARAEVSYGGFEQHEPNGRSERHGAFPPHWGGFAWPAAIVHGGLRFFERELVAADLGLPGDMYLLTRMLRAGVRFALHDEVVLDYFPSTLWEPARHAGGPSVVASLTQSGPVALPYGHGDGGEANAG